MRVTQPRLQFGQGDVGVGQHVLADRVMIGGQLGSDVTSLRPHRSLAGPPLATQGFRDIGDTDQKLLRDLAHPQPRFPRRKHPLAQILRIRSATLPKHADLRPTVPETHESHLVGVSEATIPLSLSVL